MNKLAIFLAFCVAAVSAVLYVAGYLDPPSAFYPVPLVEARARLDALELPPLVFPPQREPFAFHETLPNHFEGEILNGDDVHSLFKLKLEAEGRGTRATLDYIGISDDAVRRMKLLPAARHVFFVAMRETIAAALTQKPFNETPVYASALIASALALTPFAPEIGLQPTFHDPAVPLR